MKEEKKRARLIYNPTSGQEIIKQNIAEVLEVLESIGYETSAFQTKPNLNTCQPRKKQKELQKLALIWF